MKINFIFLILPGLICNFARAQTVTVEGTVTDMLSRQPIPLATISVQGINSGAVADEKGNFHFSVNAAEIKPGGQVTVSSVGYAPARVPIEKFKKGRQVIQLVVSSTPLKTIMIRPDSHTIKVFGRTGNGTILAASMVGKRDQVNDSLGSEQASIIGIDEHCLLKDFNMLVCFNNFERVELRLNIYDVKNGLPCSLIIDKDILFDVTQKNGWVKVDLAPYNIYLDGYKQIALAIQWVKSVRTDNPVTAASFAVSVMPVPFHTMLFRNKLQPGWKKFSPAYTAFNLTADSFKPGK